MNETLKCIEDIKEEDFYFWLMDYFVECIWVSAGFDPDSEEVKQEKERIRREYRGKKTIEV